jgi:hypothetical protein
VTPSITPTNTSTPTNTPSVTPSQTETQTPTPTNTETPTVTPSQTETQTPTPTNTETQTPTPTVTPTVTIGLTPTPTPTNTRIGFTVNSGSTQLDACTSVNPPVTIYGNTSQFDTSYEFWNVLNGDSTVDMTGYYQNGGYVIELDSNGNTVGPGQIC